MLVAMQSFSCFPHWAGDNLKRVGLSLEHAQFLAVGGRGFRPSDHDHDYFGTGVRLHRSATAHARDRSDVRPQIGDELGVTEQQWSDFVVAEITPRFPKGLSIDDTVGQWREPDKNMIVKEPSKDVTIVVPQSEPVKEKIEAIAAAYKQRFQQQSVGVVMRPAGVSF
jgi:hypothetical protein